MTAPDDRMSHSANRVLYVTREPRDHMNVCVKDRLTCGLPRIEADVIAIGREGLVELFLYGGNDAQS